jgi:hypothetical protein
MMMYETNAAAYHAKNLTKHTNNSLKINNLYKFLYGKYCVQKMGADFVQHDTLALLLSALQL